jgi:hypothetical protein
VAADRHDKGTRIEIEATIEIEGVTRPAIVARNLLLIEDE